MNAGERFVLKTVAVHEAGHVVAGWALGVTVWRAVVTEDRGETVYDTEFTARDREKNALTTAAGTASEFLLQPAAWSRARAAGLHDDGDRALLVRLCGGRRRRRTLDRWMLRATELLAEREALLRRVAAELLARRVLSRRDLEALRRAS